MIDPPLGDLYDVGGHRLMLYRSGSGAPYRVLQDAGPMVPYQRPDAVIRAVRDVVSAIRA